MEKRIFKIMEMVLGIGIAAFIIRWFGSRFVDKKSSGERMKVYYNIMNKWMKLREEHKSIAEYLEGQGIQTVAIYGLGDMGKHLEKELEDSKITVKYAINKDAAYLILDLDVYSPDRDLPPVDAVIVTPVMEYDEICRGLREKVSCPILSIADVINASLGIV